MVLKLEHLHEVLKQFIKITEYAREGRLDPSTISKAQLQKEITEIHTKMEDYEFPIPTSHIRAESLSQIGKTDIKTASGKLLISVDIPLPDRKALQLCKIYSFPVYQNERKFFFADKHYYDTCQKTSYHNICE